MVDDGDERARILVCDDELLTRRLYRQFFRKRKEDFLFRFAANGKEGLDKIARSSYHVLITDINMPEMDGISLLERIKDEGISIISIVVTAYGAEQADRAVQAGCFQLLHKPVDFSVLSIVIENSIKEYYHRYGDVF